MQNIFSDMRRTRQLTQFFTILFMWSLAEGMITFYFPLHLEHELKSVILAGALLGISSLASVITDLIFGFVSEISDYRRFLYIGVGAYLLIIPLLAFGEGFIPLFIAILLWGFQYELVLNFGAPVFLAKHSPHGDFPKYSSISFLIRNIGFFVGPIIADFLRIDNIGMLYLFNAILLIVILFMLYTSFTHHAGHEHEAKVRHLSLLSEVKIVKRFLPQVFPFLVLGFGIGVYESVFIIFGPIEFANSTDIAGILSATVILANIVVPAFSIWILKKYKERNIITLSALAMLIVSVVYMLTSNELLLAAMIFLAFSLLAMIFLAKDSAFLRLLSKIRTSEEDEAVSISSLGPNTAYVIVGVFGGVMMQSMGFGSVVVSAAIVLIVCVVIFLIFRPNGASGTTPKMHSKR